ncbi:hypothetical protein [Streptomyces sp. R35]|uniref:Tn3 transposase DDE domain-containing protein n=1 Tax=Streptomyces sp. R35 TaxID=3238630 RepID=A0AB39SJX2_9ACTN
MGTEPDEALKRTAAALAYVCTNVEQIREDLRSGLCGDDTPLEQLLAAIRHGDDLIGPLDLLHAHLQADGDARGIYGHSGDSSTIRSFRPAGIDSSSPPGPSEVVYLCPATRCSRIWWPQATASVPQCRISGEHLRRERL